MLERQAGAPGGRVRRALLTALLFLSLLLVLFAGPVRVTANRYGTGPLEAARIMTVNLLRGPVRVGIQVGHLDAINHPEEHRDLRWNFGGHANGVDELDINIAVAERLKSLLEAAGVTVELLPASVPAYYTADAVISVHADSVDDPARNGYKSAHFEPLRNSQDPLLKEHIDTVFLAGSGLRDDSVNTSSGMIRYYAFNPRYRHSVNTRSPALLVELGYISNRADLRFLLDPGQPAALLAEGIIAFLTDIRRLPPARR